MYGRYYVPVMNEKHQQSYKLNKDNQSHTVSRSAALLYVFHVTFLLMIPDILVCFLDYAIPLVTIL